MTKSYRVHNLDCAACAAKLERAIKKVDGISDASVNFLTQKITLDMDDNRLDEVIKNVVKTCKKAEPDMEIVGI